MAKEDFKGIIFISDVHFGANPESDQEILQDLNSLIHLCITERYRLIVLGDLFDYWMEFDDYYPEFGEPILDLFERINKFQKTLYITGNHDNWGGKVLSEKGFDVESEYRILDISNHKVLLLHGDGLKSKHFKFPRPFFHRILRNELFVSLYKFIAGRRIGLNLMKWFSEKSRDENVDTSQTKSKLKNWATNYLTRLDAKASIIIAGHTHQSKLQITPSGLYINIGRFNTDRTLLIYTNRCFKLVTWDGENSQIVLTEKMYCLENK